MLIIPFFSKYSILLSTMIPLFLHTLWLQSCHCKLHLLHQTLELLNLSVLPPFKNYSLTFSWTNYFIAMFSMTFHPLMASKVIYLAWNFLWFHGLYIYSFLLPPVCYLTGNTGITCPKRNVIFAIILKLLYLGKWWLHPSCCSSYDHGSHMWLFSHYHPLQPISHGISILNAFSDTAHYHGSSFWHFCLAP